MTQHRQTVDVLYISGHGGAAKKYIIETAIVVPFISLERIDFNSAFCDGTSRYGVPENLTTG